MNAPEVVFPNLGITITKLNRVAFNLFGMENFQIYWYAIFITTGIICGVLLANWCAKRTGQTTDLYADFILFVVPISIIGARVFYIVFNWSLYKDDLVKIFMIREGGLAIYGAVIAAFLTAFIYTRIKKMSVLVLLDTLIAGLAIGQSIGRWGNFFNKEVFGGYTNNLFAMRYLVDQVSAADISREIADKIIMANGAQYIQVHPTFLYEAALTFALALFIFLYLPKKKFAGEPTAYYLVIYGIGRYFIEGIRTDQLFLWNMNVPVSQVVSIIAIIVGFVFLIYNYLKLARNRIKS